MHNQKVLVAKHYHYALLYILFAGVIFATYWQQDTWVFPQYDVDNLADYVSYHGDVEQYLAMANGQDAIAPYRYRPIAPLLASLIGFKWLNLLAGAALATLMTHYIVRFEGLSLPYGIIGGLLSITVLGFARTAIHPMIDIMTMLMALLIAYTARGKHWLLCAPAIFIGIWTKEVLVIFALLPLVLYRRDWRAWMMPIIGVIAFVAIRIMLGDSAISVNYGYNAAAGELPQYIMRLFDYRRRIVAFELFAAFNIMPLALPFGTQQTKRMTLYLVPITIIAALLLSSRIARPLSVLYVVVVPSVVSLIAKKSLSKSQTV